MGSLARRLAWSGRDVVAAVREATRLNWRDPLAREFWRRRPWVTCFEIGGRVYGGSADLVDDARVERFAQVFPSAERVLELGSLEGAHSFSLARRGLTVVAVEGRRDNVEKALFVQRLLGLDEVTFVCADLDEISLADLGSFDAVFCVGLLYHLRRPWRLIDELAGVAPGVLLQTHFACEATATSDGVPGAWYGEFGGRDPLSGLSASSFWMTLPAIEERLGSSGFRIESLEQMVDHPNGPLVTLVARR